MKTKPKTYYQYRSSISGLYVSEEYALKNPVTTQRIRRYRKPECAK